MEYELIYLKYKDEQIKYKFKQSIFEEDFLVTASYETDTF